MAIKLREDQMMLVERVLKNIREDNLVVSPSGSGKSYILAYLEKLLTEQGYLNKWQATLVVEAIGAEDATAFSELIDDISSYRVIGNIYENPELIG